MRYSAGPPGLGKNLSDRQSPRSIAGLLASGPLLKHKLLALVEPHIPVAEQAC